MKQTIQVKLMGVPVLLVLDDELPRDTLLFGTLDGRVQAHLDLNSGQTTRILNDDGTYIDYLKAHKEGGL